MKKLIFIILSISAFSVLAANSIQNQIDAAVPGDVVTIPAGTYSDYGGNAYGPNVICIDKAITVQASGSVILDGSGEMRCAYVGNGGKLIGVTLKNGNPSAGGFWQNRAGGGALCADSGIISNCTASSCFAEHGAGFMAANGGLIVDCTANDNNANFDGGGFSAVEGGMLVNCISKNNKAASAGGIDISGGIVDRCTITDNDATFDGAGAIVAFGGDLRNSLLTKNFADGNGGGVQTETPDSIIRNCTIASNNALQNGGGISSLNNGHIWNSIFYLNNCVIDGSNLYVVSADIKYSCPYNGTGCLPFDPQLNSDYMLSPFSSCVNAGENALAAGNLDLAGNPRIFDNFVDMGAYEDKTKEISPTTIGKTKAILKINWSKGNKDMMTFYIDLSKPDDLILDKDSDYMLRFGDYKILSSQMDSSRTKPKPNRLIFQTAKNTIPAIKLDMRFYKKDTMVKIIGKVKKADIASNLQNYGVVNTNTPKAGIAITVPASVLIGDYRIDKMETKMNYKSKEDKKAKAKSLK